MCICTQSVVFCLISMLQPLRQCFETKNVATLQHVLSQMSKEEATYHMQRCIDSGLWVSDAKAAGKAGKFTVKPSECPPPFLNTRTIKSTGGGDTW